MEYRSYLVEATPIGYNIYRSYDAWRDMETPVCVAGSMEEAQRWIDRQIDAADHLIPPRWTVVSNILSLESDKWVGTCWEFFDEESQAEECYTRQIEAGNTPTKRPYFESSDRGHLGAVHGRS